MSVKYLLLYLVALIVITGCIEKPQTQAEKMGWNQVEYDQYSAYYEGLVNNTLYLVNNTSTLYGKSLDEILIDIPKDNNEFEKTWYYVFYYRQKGNEIKNNFISAKCRYVSESDNIIGIYSTQDDVRECISANQRGHEMARGSYIKALEYRTRIELMKVNLSR